MAEKVKSYGAGILFVVFIGILIWFAATLSASNSYEVKPEISIEPYQSDTAKAINAYEKLFNRYMDLTESNFKNIALDNQRTYEQLRAIEQQLSDLNKRISKIEEKLGLETEQPQAVKIETPSAGATTPKRKPAPSEIEISQ